MKALVFGLFARSQSLLISDEGFEIHEKNNESVEAKIKQNEMLATSKFTVINNGYIGTQKTVSIETINGDINL